MYDKVKIKKKIVFLFILLLLTAVPISFIKTKTSIDNEILSYTVDPKKQDLKFYWKNDKDEKFKSIEKLKKYIESNNQRLLFAMNGGMYTKEHSPQGLYIQDQKTLTPLDTNTGKGNFYLKPNGVFYITIDNIPVVSKTTDFVDNGRIQYATQSGPMLVIDGHLHSAFTAGSKNLNIRNGVGILPDGKIIFAMSKKEINFYDFADYFKRQGCKNALYLDGFVSRTYLPEKGWTQTDGNFGVIIGVTENK